jgi:hypothetical protein
MRASASKLLRRALALAACALGVASCTAVLSLDGYHDAPTVLCQMLQGCYADGASTDCHARIVDALGSADPDLIDSWIKVMGAGCLDNCTAARFCLDARPVCQADLRGTCQRREDCCLFSEGARDCSPSGACCLTAGQPCDSDEQCCPGAGLCSQLTRTCGGTVCRPVGVRCDIDEECCSRRCQDNVCTANICDPDGFRCQAAGTCCSEFCRPDGYCGAPATCQLLLGECTADGDCGPVNGHAGICFTPTGASVGVCSDAPTCFPDEAECQGDALCCSGHCNAAYHRCSQVCTTDTLPCQGDADCCNSTCDVASGECSGCSLGGCSDDSQCCSKRCVAGTCGPICAQPTCAHTVCETGEPLSVDCGTSGDACAAAVCDTDAYCCCNLWDAFCVNAAAAAPACAGLCP